MVEHRRTDGGADRLLDLTFTAPAATRITCGCGCAPRRTGIQRLGLRAVLRCRRYGRRRALPIGTTDGLIVNLASRRDGKQSEAAGDGRTARTADATDDDRIRRRRNPYVRIQTREDGVSIDQSCSARSHTSTTAPGGLSSDATIVPKPGTVTSRCCPRRGRVRTWSDRPADSAWFSGGILRSAAQAPTSGARRTPFSFVSHPSPATHNSRAGRRAPAINAFAKAGGDVPRPAAAGAANVLLDVRPDGRLSSCRARRRASATNFLSGGTHRSAWLRLTRNSASSPARCRRRHVWTPVGITNVRSRRHRLVGLVVTSHDVTTLDTATFDNVDITLPPSAAGSPAPMNTSGGSAGHRRRVERGRRYEPHEQIRTSSPRVVATG